MANHVHVLGMQARVFQLCVRHFQMFPRTLCTLLPTVLLILLSLLLYLLNSLSMKVRTRTDFKELLVVNCYSFIFRFPLPCCLFCLILKNKVQPASHTCDPFKLLLPQPQRAHCSAYKPQYTQQPFRPDQLSTIQPFTQPKSTQPSLAKPRLTKDSSILPVS